MAALKFFVRPTLLCSRCGSVVMQQVHDDAPDARDIWCAMKSCPQFERRATVIDQHLIFFEQPSDVVLDTHGNH